MPPSAMTVCALPRRLLLITPVDSFSALHSMAARRPAPPAPMPSTSCSMVCNSDASRAMALPAVEVVDDVHRTETHVDVGHHDPDEAGPGELHVTRIEPARLLERAERDGRLATIAHAVLPTTDEVAERVAAKRVAGDQHDIDRQDDAADADAGHAVLEERLERTFPEQDDEHEREVQRVA